jgi:hypothetical protein
MAPISGFMHSDNRKPLMKREQLIKLKRLLCMQYRPAEIAEEIGVTVDTIYRSYIPAGAPHKKDNRGNIWIVGTEFTEWAKEYHDHKYSKKFSLKDGQAWCMSCNQAVNILDPKIKRVNRYISMIQGTCENCGKKVNRAASASKISQGEK